MAININNIDKEAFLETWNEILSVMQSMETDKQALKNLKAELGTIIGADNSKETNTLVKALLKKHKDQEFYDTEAVETAQEFWDEIIEDWRTPREE